MSKYRIVTVKEDRVEFLTDNKAAMAMMIQKYGEMRSDGEFYFNGIPCDIEECSKDVSDNLCFLPVGHYRFVDNIKGA